MKNYASLEDEEAAKRLQKMVAPFILRRIKRDVLKELPDKTVTVLNNEMCEEQRNLYINYLWIDFFKEKDI